MSLHAFDSGSTDYSSVWRNNIQNCRSQINSNIPMITPKSWLINDIDIIGTSQASFAGIVSLYIYK